MTENGILGLFTRPSNLIEPNFRDQCLAAGVPFFFKQWRKFNKKKAGRLLDGRSWDDMLVFAAAHGHV
jgi:protein gp37